MVALAAPRVAAQAVRDTAALAQMMREATARFADRDVAIAEGYRVIGPDFPGMAEHWINVALVMSGTLDPARPTLLSYATVKGVPTLVGAGFMQLLAPGDTAPSFPAGRDAWHYHTGTIDGESFSEHHHPMETFDGTRLAMLHVWVQVGNPAGMFVKNNWALPYVRVGLDPPEHPDSLAASALAAGTANRSYFRERWLHEGLDVPTVDSLLDADRAAVHTALSLAPGRREAALASLWRRVLRQVAQRQVSMRPR